MGPEFVTVETGGQIWTAFTHMRVSADLDKAAREWWLEIAFEPGQTATANVFKAGAKLSISSNGDQLVTGYVDNYKPRIAATQAAASITGRSLAADAIDGAAIHKTGRFENKTLLQITQELDRAKVGFSTDVPLDVIPKAQVRPGETVFQFAERYARAHNLTLTSAGNGGIRFYDASSPKRHAGALLQGVNIVQAEADHDWSTRHSHYVVRGQAVKGTGVDALEIEAVAKDISVDRWRPTVIVVQEDIDKPRAAKHAKHRRDRKAGRSLSARVTVQGFHDDDGVLWEPGWLIYLESTALDIAADMLIKTVEFTQDDGGSLTSLSLVDPRAYAGKKARGGKNGKTWDQGDDDAQVTPDGGTGAAD